MTPERETQLRATIAADSHGVLPTLFSVELRDALDEARAASAEREAALVAMSRCLAFFACTIKSGEPWSETCEREYTNVVAAYNAIKEHR